jgi:hypothetical protein
MLQQIDDLELENKKLRMSKIGDTCTIQCNTDDLLEYTGIAKATPENDPAPSA